MRTSNKILLSIFLAPLVILTCINLTLYAKYKSGHYIAMTTVQKDRFARHALNNITQVAVYGLDNFRIIPADSGRLEIENRDESHLHYTIDGNSLIIHGDSTLARPGKENDVQRSYEEVKLYLPATATITADNSQVKLEGSKDSAKASSYQFSLTNSSSFKIEDIGSGDSNHVYFDNLAIKASHVEGIELTDQSRIASLQLTLVESDFTDNGATIHQLTVEADKKSNISLKGDNLKRLTASKQP